ncbi:iron ABC transporter permease [Cryobacterium sp. SO2]|uniref:FecCD family ABC transporter permease n=1 Tax=Cryobacterium sp. SO2 TaxID=1897060 RepID=UPI00223D6CC5|nr:iron ABC transporter permease [Cryobacterium sp. SO2]WEO78443.1 iron ABC transporter permease [Cryobacterium sp. SO2]
MTATPSSVPSASLTRVALVGVLVVLAVVVVAVISLLIGTRQFDPATVFGALTGTAGEEAQTIVLGQRVPRTLLGIVGGAALAIGGALVQAHTRNPLADPGLLGVTAGSALAVVLAVSLLGVTTPLGYLWFAFAGAATGTVLVAVFGTLATRRRDAGPASLVLAGAAISALLSAVTGVILLLDTATLDVYRFWTVGSLAGGRGTEALGVVWPFLVVGFILAVAQAPALNALALGDDIARSLGRNLAGTRALGLAAVVLLVGGAVACIGSLGFVGLVAPHLVRRLCRDDQRAVIPLSAAAGALLVLLADIVGRVVVAPAELPVGITLGVLGGPAFLLLVISAARRRRRPRAPRARTLS